MHPTVAALRDTLATVTAGAVRVVNAPTDRTTGQAASIWVWRVEEDGASRPVGGGPQQPVAAPALQVSCLVFAPDLDALELVRQAAFHNPVVIYRGQRITIRSRPLDATVLLTVFLAAKVKIRPCLSLVLSAAPA